ncbi:MAG: amidohydrolase family protein [Desulfuromonadaceae bacterium]|nr:amidohydrolase family protein [Desulfuromonadaceae bacterium]MDD2855837.1 amidohydrolase family protein [Desulfuromonadaceae bacterium]
MSIVSTYLKTDDLRIFDAHFHIIDPRFRLTGNNGYLPDNFTCADYLNIMKGKNLVGGAVVSGSFQGFDQNYLIDALAQLGSSFYGVTQISLQTTDEEIAHLNRCGVRAVRFNLKRGGSEKIEHLDRLARRVYELAGWHTELYIDSTELNRLYDDIVALPSVSIDHLGLSSAGFRTILMLAERGVRIKASGFGRVDFDVPTALREIYAASPDALMFGSDLPSTRTPRPYKDEDLTLVFDTLGDTGAAKVLYENAISFYAHN